MVIGRNGYGPKWSWTEMVVGGTKYSTHHSLLDNTGFKSLAFILFEMLHLQNCDVKFQIFQRAITQKNHMIFFF